MVQKYLMSAFSLSLIILFTALFGYAEDIRNYSQCEVCPGTIHYGPDEAREIMGPKGLELVRKTGVSEKKIIKLDMDGVMKSGSADDRDMGYEVKISAHQNIIYIRSLTDGSYIQIVTDVVNAHRSGLLSEWYPEIYLQSDHSDQISLQETIDTAWKKMAESHIYQWLTSGKENAAPAPLLADKIVFVLGLITKKSPLK